MTNEIGIMGTGRMAVRLARLFAEAGNDVRLGSRTPARAKRIAEGLGMKGIVGCGYDEAAAAPVVLPSMFMRDGMLDTLAKYKDAFAGKVYIDITNPFNADYTDFIIPWDDSGAEQVQKAFPDARVVGAFKNVWFEVFDKPVFEGGVLSDVYVVSDDDEAKKEFFSLLGEAPFRFVDAGRLANARFVERMTLFATELSQRYGYFPRANWKFLGEPWEQGQSDTVAHLIARD